MSVPIYFPCRQTLYVWGVFLVSIVLVAFSWFTIHYLLVKIQPVAISIAENIGSDSDTYDLANTFIGHLDNWLAVIGILAVAVGCYQYAQKRGRPVYGY